MTNIVWKQFTTLYSAHGFQTVLSRSQNEIYHLWGSDYHIVIDQNSDGVQICRFFKFANIMFLYFIYSYYIIISCMSACDITIEIF